MLKLRLGQLIQFAVGLSVTVILLAVISQQAFALGLQPLWLRGALVALATVAALVALYPFNPIFKDRPGAYAAWVCLPAALPGMLFFVWLLPQQAESGFRAEQLNSSLITDSSSNGYVEVGFSYPIFTPAIEIENRELYSRYVNVFLRLIDSEGEVALYRAVRELVPGSGLSVEASVRGLLAANEDYLFLPLALPPRRAVSGRLVFVISNLDDGSSFTRTLASASSAQFELRDPESGALLQSFPLLAI